MNRRLLLATLVPFAMLVASHPAAARDFAVFGAQSLSDAALSDVHGRSWFLTRVSLGELSDNEGSQYSQWVGQNGRTQMDVWWGTTGSELIAESVRSAGMGS